MQRVPRRSASKPAAGRYRRWLATSSVHPVSTSSSMRAFVSGSATIACHGKRAAAGFSRRFSNASRTSADKLIPRRRASLRASCPRPSGNEMVVLIRYYSSGMQICIDAITFTSRTVAQPVHSYRSASIGRRSAALDAGRMPNTTPTAPENPIANPTAQSGTTMLGTPGTTAAMAVPRP